MFLPWGIEAGNLLATQAGHNELERLAPIRPHNLLLADQ